MLKPGLTQLFTEYASAHQHPTNRLTHKIAIPLIVFHILAMLDWIHIITVPGTGFTLTGGHLFYAGAMAWYFTQDVKLATVIALVCLPMFPIAHLLPKLAIVAIAAGGWLIQLAGHVVWEKKSPSFLTNLIHALVGPLFFIAILVGDWPPKAATVPANRTA